LDSDRELRWTVALEAALFFSIPCWSLSTDRAWPSDTPYQFAFAVLAGASMALVLCHITPATCETAMRSLLSSRSGRALGWPVRAWFCVGAMASLIQLAHLAGSMSVLWRDATYFNKPVWRSIAAALAVIYIAASLAIAANRRWNQPVIALSLTSGVFLSFTGVIAQSSGLQTHRWISEAGFNAPYSIFKGMVLSATPAAILALRIGRMRLPPRTVVWTGVLGVWLPLVASVSLVSFAKMCGARLYWKPSLPIELTYAFVWLLQATNRLAVLLWPLAVTVLASCIVCAVWIVDFICECAWSWPRILASMTVAAIGYAIASSFTWELYYSYWLLSIALGCLLLGLAQLIVLLTNTILAKLR
jgi:hypothetical protein